ncbi:MAG TPA: VOC family protein [Aquimonas sp.]|nr:VOC family protein [Xanthomonadales bacterium]HRD71729.1 VOC family protein [Aquimonas sp.]HRF53435.1 VOC family protein [Aquimonas sp.]
MPIADIAIPQLPSRSMVRTIRFYTALGFDVEVVSPHQDYAIGRRGSLEVHFFLHPGLLPRESSFGCYFRVGDVDALYAQFSTVNLPNAGIPRITTLENKPWGLREFAIVDEDGSLIRIGQVI